jgi:type I restriction enzyme S subunit
MNNVNHRPLSELCETTITSIDPKRKPELEFWYVDISAVDNILKQITSQQKIQGKFASVRARQVILKNDVLIATTRPNLNAVALVHEQYDSEVCSTGFCVLRVGSELDPEYLYYFTRSQAFVNSLTDLTKGVFIRP